MHTWSVPVCHDLGANHQGSCRGQPSKPADPDPTAVVQGGLPLVCPLRCPGALVVVPNHTLRRMVEVLAPGRSHALVERTQSTILTHDDAVAGIVPALRRARSSLKRGSMGAAEHSGVLPV